MKIITIHIFIVHNSILDFGPLVFPHKNNRFAYFKMKSTGEIVTHRAATGPVADQCIKNHGISEALIF